MCTHKKDTNLVYMSKIFTKYYLKSVVRKLYNFIEICIK